jgi:hypothetical protein
MANKSASPYPSNGDRTAIACARREKHWRKILEECERSGLRRSEFCRRNGLRETTLSWWARELRRRDQAGRKSALPKVSPARKSPGHAFVPVRVIEAPARETVQDVEVVTRGGHVVRVRPGFDAATLRQVIAALEGQPC